MTGAGRHAVTNRGTSWTGWVMASVLAVAMPGRSATSWSPGPAAPGGLTGRAGTVLSYHPTLDRVVLFGGYDGTGFFDETWEYDGSAWTAGPAAPVALTPRAFGAMTYDSTRDTLVTFGGTVTDLNTFTDETWEYDGSWTQGPVAPGGLTPRAYVGLAYDEQMGQSVLFGGYDGAATADTWLYDGLSWTAGPAAPAPLTARYGHKLVSDGTVIVLFGGFDGSFLNDTWFFDGASWTAGPGAPAGLTGRTNAAMAYDSARQRTVMFGGQAGITYLNETWELVQGAWVVGPAAPAALTRRRFVDMAYDGGRDALVLFGGQAVAGYQNTTWIYACNPITVSPSTLAGGTEGLSYSQTIAASGGTAPYSFNVTGGSLPPGLALDPATGVLAGFPSAMGSYSFTVTVRDATDCAVDQPYSLVICGVIVLSPSVLPDGTLGTPYTATLTASGGSAPYSYAVSGGALPPGLALDPATGDITGTPTALGNFAFDVEASDALGCLVAVSYDITIACPTITLAPALLPDGIEGISYSQQLTASGGVGPYAYALTSGSLPPGLALDPATGLISGTPTTAGTYSFDITATDQTGCTGIAAPRQAFTLRIRAASDYLVGEGLGQPNGNRVRVYKRDGQPSTVAFDAYGAGQWGTNVAAGDVNGGDGDEILTGPGPGAVYGPQVRGFFRDGSPLAKINFFAYSTLRYGVNAAATDGDGDGFEEILSAAGPGAVFGPHVRGWNFDAASLTAIAKVNFFAYSTLKYGANVGGGDIEADGYGEIITGPGPGAIFGPVVRAFNHDGGTASSIAKVNFSAFTMQQYGVNVAGGDVDVDGYAEIGAAPGPGPTIGARFRGFDFDGVAIVPLTGFDSAIFSSLYGGRLGLGDIDGDGGADLVAGAGQDPAADSSVRARSYSTGSLVALTGTPFVPFTSLYGVNVTAAELGYR